MLSHGEGAPLHLPPRAEAGWRLDGPGPSAKPEATSQERRLAGVTVLEQTLPLCKGYREGKPATENEPGRVAVVFIAEGREWGASGGHSVLLEPGSLAIWHTSQSLGFQVVEPLRKFTFLFDEAELAASLPRSPELCCGVVKRESPLGPLLDGYFRGLIGELDTLPSRYHESAIAMTREIVAKALRAEQAAVALGPGEVLFARIVEHIERSLHDSTMSPETLAAAHGISLRYLHLLFSRHDLQVASWIRQRRLERCREALGTDPEPVNITNIALKWGFNDSSHFSRLFSKAFGVSPKVYRRLCRAALPVERKLNIVPGAG